MDAASLAKRLQRPEHTLSPEDRERLRPILAGTDDPALNEDGTLQVWNPREKAVTATVQAPKALRTVSWEKAAAFAKISYHGFPLVIVGAGSSILNLDLQRLNAFPSMGVNWTLKYFQPTYLHILDKQPMRTQVVENLDQQNIRPQVITCRQTRDWAIPLGLKVPVLAYESKDDSCGKYPAFKLAEKGDDLFQHFPNSLGYALQAGVALGFKKIILIGFDFGGFHFFGDGRSTSCANHFGAMGEMKLALRPMLMAQAHYMHRHGFRVVQVGPTDLADCYDIVDSLEAAENALK